MKLGIIRCMQTEDYCPGTADFKTNTIFTWKSNIKQYMCFQFFNNIKHYKKVIQNVEGGSFIDVSATSDGRNYSKTDLEDEDNVDINLPYFAKNDNDKYSS